MLLNLFLAIVLDSFAETRSQDEASLSPEELKAKKIDERLQLGKLDGELYI